MARSTLRNANLRCGVIGLLNGVAGARPGTVAMTSPSPRFSPSMPPTTVLTTGARVGSTLTSSLVMRTVWTGRHAAFAAALAASSGQLGAFSGCHGLTGGSSRPAGVRSSRTVRSSAPDAPSIAAWWILV